VSESLVAETYGYPIGFNIVESLGKLGFQMSNDSDRVDDKTSGAATASSSTSTRGRGFDPPPPLAE
jgi:hypothetical protein